MEALTKVTMPAIFAFVLRSLVRCIRGGILCLAIISPLRQGCADDLPSLDGLPAPDDPTELQRTWDASAVYLKLPDADIDLQSTLPPQARDIFFAKIPAGTKLPAILFMHGCRGMGGEGMLLTLLASRGYAVFEPDGFARKRPVICGRWPLDHPTVMWALNASMAEITFGAEQLRQLPWIDSTHLYLAGFSRGGELTAWYPGDEFKARVSMSASCRRGIQGRSPLLAIFAKNDTEMTDFTERCSKATKYLENNSQAHEVYRSLDVQKAIFDWLDRHLVHTWGKQRRELLFECCTHATSRIADVGFIAVAGRFRGVKGGAMMLRGRGLTNRTRSVSGPRPTAVRRLGPAALAARSARTPARLRG